MVLKIIKKSGAAAPVAKPEDPKPEIVIPKSVRVTKPEPTVQVTEQVPIKSETKFDPQAWRALPIAASWEELEKSAGKMRAPDPTECSLCHHQYGFPCHGKNAGCMNAKFAKGEVA